MIQPLSLMAMIVILLAFLCNDMAYAGVKNVEKVATNSNECKSGNLDLLKVETTLESESEQFGGIYSYYTSGKAIAIEEWKVYDITPRFDIRTITVIAKSKRSSSLSLANLFASTLGGNSIRSMKFITPSGSYNLGITGNGIFRYREIHENFYTIKEMGSTARTTISVKTEINS